MKSAIKSFTAILLCAVLSFAAVISAFAGDTTDGSLQFNSDGSFKILVFSDCQDVYPENKTMVEFINESLDSVKPDLVVFLGDNMVEKTNVEGAIAGIVTPVQERGIPFTLVFGNHDDQNLPAYPKETQLAIYRSYSCCVAEDSVPSLHGCGTQELTIKSSDGSKDAFALWMFDSGSYATGRDGSCYDCVHEDQIRWYKQESAALEAANGGKVPSLAFQHIICKQIFDAVFTKTAQYLNEDVTRHFSDGSVFTLTPDLSKIDGTLLETPGPSYNDYGEWNAFVERGDVLGCVTGHDHINSFIASYKGVDFIQTPGMTYYSYGRDSVRGARVITLNEKDPWNYQTKVLTVREQAVTSGSKLTSIAANGWLFPLENVFFRFVDIFKSLFKFV